MYYRPVVERTTVELVQPKYAAPVASSYSTGPVAQQSYSAPVASSAAASSSYTAPAQVEVAAPTQVEVAAPAEVVETEAVSEVQVCVLIFLFCVFASFTKGFFSEFRLQHRRNPSVLSVHRKLSKCRQLQEGESLINGDCKPFFKPKKEKRSGCNK